MTRKPVPQSNLSPQKSWELCTSENRVQIVKSVKVVLRKLQKTRRRNHDDIRAAAAEWDTEHLGLKLERERVREISRVLVIEYPQVSSENRPQLVENLP